MARRGISRLSLETFLSHSTGRAPRRTIFFQKFSGIKKLHKRCISTLSKIDSLTVPQDFVGEPFNFQKFSFIRNIMARRGISGLSLETSLSHSSEELLGGPFFRKISGIKKLHKMVYHDFVENWFSHSTENFRRGLLQFSEKFFYRKVSWIGNGYQEFLWKLFCPTVPKKLIGGRLCFRNFLD